MTFAPLGDLPVVPEGVLWFLAMVAALTLIGAPQPRLLTKWGWFWALVPGIGLLPYLVFGGSTHRATTTPSGRRLNGWVVALAPVAIGMTLGLLSLGLRDVEPPNLRGVLNPAPVTTGDFREPPRER